jgi:hypothetical protein
MFYSSRLMVHRAVDKVYPVEGESPGESHEHIPRAESFLVRITCLCRETVDKCIGMLLILGIIIFVINVCFWSP